MHPFGGSQLCPTCSKPVYAAEQVLGPGRKLYHKPCLSCMICKKRLDSYTLLEHDQEPYCKSCYSKNFSTRDLRQANLPVRETSLSPTPTSPPKANTTLPVSSPIRQTQTASPRLKPTHTLRTRSSTPDRKTPPETIPETESDQTDSVPTVVDTNASPLPSRPRPTHTPSKSIGSLSSTTTNTTRSTSPSSSSPRFNPNPNFNFATFGRGGGTQSTTSAAINLLEQEGIPNPLTQTSTGTRYGAALGGTVTIDMNRTGSGTGTPASSPRKWGGDTPDCPKCSKRVYFAEQVKAVGKTWHKNCLRCQECNTLLDSNRLRDHDNVPFCVRCYSKHHGPQGAGYALLGKAGA